MGADGGLNYAELKEGKRERFVQLIAPLGLLEYKLCDADIDWLENNSWIYDGNYIYSRYGSFEAHQGLSDLADFIEWHDTDERTFEYLILDVKTMPDWQLREAGELDKFMFKLCEYSTTYLSVIGSMRVCDWVKEIKSSIIGGIGSVETWT